MPKVGTETVKSPAETTLSPRQCRTLVHKICLQGCMVLDSKILTLDTMLCLIATLESAGVAKQSSDLYRPMSAISYLHRSPAAPFAAKVHTG